MARMNRLLLAIRNTAAAAVREHGGGNQNDLKPTLSDNCQTADCPSVQRHHAFGVGQFCRRNQLLVCNRDAKQFAIQIGRPKIQEGFQFRETWMQIIVLPDICLQQRRMVWQTIKDLCSRQTKTGELFCEIAARHAWCLLAYPRDGDSTKDNRESVQKKVIFSLYHTLSVHFWACEPRESISEKDGRLSIRSSAARNAIQRSNQLAFTVALAGLHLL
jgi:hypothetical protein